MIYSERIACGSWKDVICIVHNGLAALATFEPWISSCSWECCSIGEKGMPGLVGILHSLESSFLIWKAKQKIWLDSESHCEWDNQQFLKCRLHYLVKGLWKGEYTAEVFYCPEGTNMQGRYSAEPLQLVCGAVAVRELFVSGLQYDTSRIWQ